MPQINCNAELKIDSEILRCRFRSKDGHCTKEEIRVRDEENAFAVCDDVDWVEIAKKEDK